MERIASFSVDHTRLQPGMYLSRRDGDTATIDLRLRRPNTGDLLSNAALHSVEHILATILRNSPEKDAVLYFGPMGCQTGFYALFDQSKLPLDGIVALLKRAFDQAAAWDKPMPGQSAVECGNYRNLDVALCRRECAAYAEVIKHWTVDQLDYEYHL
ncbi:MAG: S-ribosylhomocysteine lyase [Oscillospiraceae bacterium]|nr:S-ribosylhomocysteine lyase [Oscillospiraceae bacterium]